jgi:kumamolisin
MTIYTDMEKEMAEDFFTLKGSVPVNNHQLIGPVDAKKQLDVTVRLRRKSEKGLPTLEEFIKGERAQGITRQILADHYGSDAKDAAAVQAWANSKGLSVSRIDLGLRQVHLVGSADAMSKAFGVKLSIYRHARTHTHFRCPESDIKIPESLAGVITGVFGLNDMPVVVRHGAIRKVSRLGHQAAADPKTLFPGSFYPNEVSALYNFPDTRGANQRVAVLEFGGGFDPAALASDFTHKHWAANYSDRERDFRP